jgi:gluconokinase
MRVIVGGVSGSGKSTVGEALAQRLGAEFVDGDDLHPIANVEKMAAGIPLTDVDREPWLQLIAARLAGGDSIVVACSALKRTYRDLIAAAAPGTFFIMLDVDHDELAQRTRHREHFMPPSLLDSQLAILEPLEPDENGATVDASGSAEESVSAALAAIR